MNHKDYKITGQGIDVTTKRELKYGDETVIPVGTKLQIFFNETAPNRVLFYYNGKVKMSSTGRLRETFTGHKFNKPPGIAALERMASDGIVSTVTGKRVEPDGYGDDGSPSWLLILGLI